MKQIEEMTAEECYAELDRLRLDKQIRGRGNNPDAAHVRNVYYPAMKKKVKKRLKQLGAPATRPGDGRVYGPGAAAWQRAGGAS